MKHNPLTSFLSQWERKEVREKNGMTTGRDAAIPLLRLARFLVVGRLRRLGLHRIHGNLCATC